MTQRTKITPKEVQMWKITGFQALAIEAVWSWCQDKQMHETEQSPERDPHVSRLIFNKHAKVVQWKRKVFLNRCAMITGYMYGKRNTIDPLLHTIHKINFKWVTN